MASIVYARLNDARVVMANCEHEVAVKNNVIVNIDGTLEYGVAEKIVVGKSEESKNFVERVATIADEEQNKRLLANQPKDKKMVLDLIAKNGIHLKLVAVLRSFDDKKLLVMYTAEERVDFRVLVRELAGAFKMRIEMRQISERDEACFVGGCGACGQPICCRRFLDLPKQATIKMAKTQGQSLTPNKINGLCGKLMCCLQYEYSQYQEILAKMPRIGATVQTPQGQGVVEYNDCLRELVAVRLPDNLVKVPLAEVEVVSGKPEENKSE